MASFQFILAAMHCGLGQQCSTKIALATHMHLHVDASASGTMLQALIVPHLHVNSLFMGIQLQWCSYANMSQTQVSKTWAHCIDHFAHWPP